MSQSLGAAMNSEVCVNAGASCEYADGIKDEVDSSRMRSRQHWVESVSPQSSSGIHALEQSHVWSCWLQKQYKAAAVARRARFDGRTGPHISQQYRRSHCIATASHAQVPSWLLYRRLRSQ